MSRILTSCFKLFRASSSFARPGFFKDAGIALLFFETVGLAVLVEADDAISLGVIDQIAENGRSGGLSGGMLQLLCQALGKEDVVAENQADGLFADEICTDDESLGKTIRAGLNFVVEADAPLGTVFEQIFEGGLVFGGGDYQNVFDSGQHQGRQGVENHRFVVYRHELLADYFSDRVEPGS